MALRPFSLRAFGLLLMLSALALPLARVPDRPVEMLVARWALPPSSFITVQGGQLVHLRDEGPRDDPEPIVLIHGTGSSLHTWEGWASVLKTKHRVIRFDLPGFGLTGPFIGEPGSAYPADDYRDVTLARFTMDLIDSLHLNRFSLAGNSLGGEVAWRVALLSGERAQSLLLVDAAGYRFEPKEIPLGFRLVRLPVLGVLTENFLPRSSVAQSLRDVYGHPERVTSAQIDRYFELTLREGNRHALRMRAQQLEMGLGAARIAELRLPTLVMWGGQDKLIPPENAKHFLRDISGSRLVQFDDLGHVPQEEDPQRTVQAAAEFLAQVAAESSNAGRAK